MRMQIIMTLAFVLVGVFLGCTSKVNFDDVIGTYKLRYPYGTEELQLSQDGTYIQSVFIDGEATAKTNKGRWKFDKTESQIILIDAMIVDDFFGHLKPEYWKIQSGLSILPVKKSFGKVSLTVNPDQGFVFEKTSKKKE